MKNFTAILKANSVRFMMLATVVFAIGATALSSHASAPTAAVNIVNNSANEIRAVYLSPADSDDWSGDQLGGSVISPGATYTLSISWNQPTVKLVAEDKDGCFLSSTVDATSNSEWTITNQSARNCGGSN